jgi:hypothetical protein
LPAANQPLSESRWCGPDYCGRGQPCGPRSSRGLRTAAATDNKDDKHDRETLHGPTRGPASRPRSTHEYCPLWRRHASAELPL